MIATTIQQLKSILERNSRNHYNRHGFESLNFHSFSFALSTSLKHYFYLCLGNQNVPHKKVSISL